MIKTLMSQVNERLFPCTLSKESSKLAEEAVQLAVTTWGQKSLTELEAEEWLSYSCEKVIIFCLKFLLPENYLKDGC